ncbi:MAG: hypothetical protein ABI361_02785 [Nitrososphaera sp.]|jgi:hypothetical protein
MSNLEEREVELKESVDELASIMDALQFDLSNLKLRGQDLIAYVGLMGLIRNIAIFFAGKHSPEERKNLALQLVLEMLIFIVPLVKYYGISFESFRDVPSEVVEIIRNPSTFLPPESTHLPRIIHEWKKRYEQDLSKILDYESLKKENENLKSKNEKYQQELNMLQLEYTELRETVKKMRDSLFEDAERLEKSHKPH